MLAISTNLIEIQRAMNAELEIQRLGNSVVSPRETAILDAVRRVQYGSVEVVIHDGQIVQIERKEKVRLGQ